MRANAVGEAVRWALGEHIDAFGPAQDQYNELIARLRELRDAPEPIPYNEILTDEEYKERCDWAAQRDLAIELLALLGEE